MSYQSFYGREKGIETTTPNFKGTIIEKPMTYAEKLYEYMLRVTNSGGCLPIEDEDGDVRIFFTGIDGNKIHTGFHIIFQRQVTPPPQKKNLIQRIFNISPYPARIVSKKPLSHQSYTSLTKPLYATLATFQTTKTTYLHA